LPEALRRQTAPPLWLSFAIIAGLLSNLVPQARAIQPEAFKKHELDKNFEGGYQVSVSDTNKDGKPDVIALSTSPSQLVWYKNPTWERFSITKETNNNIDVAAHDIDGDGDQDLALAYEFSLQNSTTGGNIAWLECPDNPEAAQDWALHPVGAVPTSHRVRFANIELNGKQTLCLLNLPIIGEGAKAPDYAVPLKFTAYHTPPAYTSLLIDNTLEMAHGLRVVQWDDDASDDILTASFSGVHLFDFDKAKQTFTKQKIGEGHAGKRPAQGSSEVALGSVRSQEIRFVATIEPWHGNEVVVYEIGTPTTMGEPRVVIDDALKDGHALACIDIDKDGNDEIVAGGRGGEKSLRIYQFAAETAEWEICILDKDNIAAAGIFIADIDQDGDQDIVAIGTSTHNVVCYENVWDKVAQ